MVGVNVHSKFLVISVLTLFSASCRTTAPVSRADATPSEIVTKSPENVAANGAGKRMESAARYSDLRLWQKLETKDANSPSRSGTVRCGMDHAYISCMVQGQGGVETLLESAVSSGVRLKLVEARKDLEFEPRIVASAVCDRVDAGVPPYAGEDAKCRFESVRAYNESLIDGDAALEFSSLIRGDKPIGDGLAEMSGIISCAVHTRKVNVVCTLRAVTTTGISDDARGLSRADSVETAEKMIQTLEEIRKFTRDPAERPLPGELAGSVRCKVSNGDVEQNGRRSAYCFIRM